MLQSGWNSGLRTSAQKLWTERVFSRGSAAGGQKTDAGCRKSASANWPLHTREREGTHVIYISHGFIWMQRLVVCESRWAMCNVQYVVVWKVHKLHNYGGIKNMAGWPWHCASAAGRVNGSAGGREGPNKKGERKASG